MATRCHFLAKDKSCGLIVQEAFNFSTCFHPLTKLKLAINAQKSHHSVEIWTYLVERRGKAQEYMRSVRWCLKEREYKEMLFSEV